MNRRHFLNGLVLTTVSAALPSFADSKSSPDSVKSKDGTRIAFETSGRGPNLVLVHGGVGDRTRWQRVLPFLTPRFTVTTMDRRGHGVSGDSPNYSIQREAEDVAAVVNSRSGEVYLLGHSYGAICSYEAAFQLESKLSQLVLYEPPFEIGEPSIDLAAVTKMESLMKEGKNEDALVLFLKEIVHIPEPEIASLKRGPSWPSRVATIHSSIREIRALMAYKFDPARAAKLKVPTVLLTGSETAPHHKYAIAALSQSLNHPRLYVFQGQGHNAIDTAPEEFAEIVTDYLLHSQ
jgi:pimeloyl-ACP methyl ester carboxylesterase